MSRTALTGSRIRDRRSVAGIRQADLARSVGISPSYLNLIEHNRRRIGGKLLTDIARALEVDPSALSEGAEDELVAGLREAASGMSGGSGPRPELDRIEEFAGRLPGWASLLARTRRRAVRLERTVEILTDRLAHDPNLSASLHEVLSTVTAIRSTADILADSGEIDPNWQARFHKNIQEDARRLSEGTEALVGYLDNAPDADRSLTFPHEALEKWLAARDYHVAAFEEGGAVAEVLDGMALPSEAARDHARAFLETCRADARAMPLEPFRRAARDCAYDPARMAAELSMDLPAVLRRLAALPPEEGQPEIGRVACDGSGLLTFRKPVPGFQLPRFGAACPLWPLYEALSRPAQPVRARVEQAGRTPRAYIAFAHAQPSYPGGFGGPAVMEVEMVLIPPELAGEPDASPTREVGQTCRICPRQGCPARREASILGPAGR